MRKQIVVNCEKISFEKTLGVAGYLLQLCSALSRNNDVIFAMNDVGELEKAPARPLIERICSDIIDLERARTGTFRHSAIELVPHHFQMPNICERSILICHDLHVFDIGWKYNNVEQIRQNFRNNLEHATVVTSHFPRTYFDVERVAGVTLMNLFLVESPLMLDTQEGMNSKNEKTKELFLLYPAQLQQHKNHASLIGAAGFLKESGKPVRIICPGSDFSADVTKDLQELVEKNSLEDDIVFTGRISDEELVALYGDCAGVIIPSMAEGGAYVAFEAIAAGKPVAINDIAAARQHLKMIDAEVFWFDANDRASTVEAIEKLLSAEADTQVIRNENSRIRISQMTWARLAERFETIISWLAGERSRPVLCVDANAWNLEYK